MTLLGEQRIWENSRKDIMRLAEEAEKAFDVTQGGRGGIDLEVVKSFIGLVSAFVPPPVAGVLSKGSAVLDLVEKFKPPEHKDDPKPEISGDSAESVFSSMDSAINRGKDGWDNSKVGVPDPPPEIPRGPGGHPLPY